MFPQTTSACDTPPMAAALAILGGRAAAGASGGSFHVRFARDTVLRSKEGAQKVASSASAALFDIHRHAREVAKFFGISLGPLGVACHDLGLNIAMRLCSTPGFAPPGRLKSARLDTALAPTAMPAAQAALAAAHDATTAAASGLTSAGAAPAATDAALSTRATAAAAVSAIEPRGTRQKVAVSFARGTVLYYCAGAR